MRNKAALRPPMPLTAIVACTLAAWLLPWGRAAAQVNELGLTAGPVYYIGDLNPYRHYPKDTRLAGGAVFRHNLSDRYALRLHELVALRVNLERKASEVFKLDDLRARLGVPAGKLVAWG
ncbi:MAG: DUF6089 family protein, partial [Flavobacteriales bacterium]